jgi:hypothetical protein
LPQKPAHIPSDGGEQRRWDGQSERFGGLEVPSITFSPGRNVLAEGLVLRLVGPHQPERRVRLLEGLAVLLDEGLQRHGRAAADRLDHVVGAGEDAGLVAST